MSSVSARQQTVTNAGTMETASGRASSRDPVSLCVIFGMTRGKLTVCFGYSLRRLVTIFDALSIVACLYTRCSVLIRKLAI